MIKIQTGKHYSLHTDIVGNCFIVSDDCKFGMFDKLEREQVIRVIEELNISYDESQKLKKEVFESHYDNDRLRASNKSLRQKYNSLLDDYYELKELIINR